MWTCLRSCANLAICVWLLAHLNTLSFCLLSTHFFITLHIHLSIPHPIVVHFHDVNVVIPLMIKVSICYIAHVECEPTCTITHDTFWNIIATIALESGSCIQKKVSDLFPYHIQRWVDIVIIRNDLKTLVDVAIVDPTYTNLVHHVSTTTTHATIIATQNNARFYIKWMPGNDFIPLSTETYGCPIFILTPFLFLVYMPI